MTRSVSAALYPMGIRGDPSVTATVDGRKSDGQPDAQGARGTLRRRQRATGGLQHPAVPRQVAPEEAEGRSLRRYGHRTPIQIQAVRRYAHRTPLHREPLRGDGHRTPISVHAARGEGQHPSETRGTVGRYAHRTSFHREPICPPRPPLLGTGGAVRAGFRGYTSAHDRRRLPPGGTHAPRRSGRQTRLRARPADVRQRRRRRGPGAGVLPLRLPLARSARGPGPPAPLALRHRPADRRAPFPYSNAALCERCRAVLATLDLASGACARLADGQMPPELRARILAAPRG